MNREYISIILLAFLPLVLRTALYLLAFRFRSIRIRIIDCVIVAGAGFLVAAVPIPIPEIFRVVLSVGLAMFLITRYTEAEIFPDVILIPIAVELASTLAMSQIVLPLVR